MKTTIKKNKLIRQFHAVCHVNGLNEAEKEAIINSFGESSSKELTEQELEEAIRLVGKEPDKWRKRVLAAICGYLRTVHKGEYVDTAKSIACRAGGYSDFNKIPVSRLRDIYYEFTRKAETTKKAQYVKADIEFELSKRN